MKLVTAGIKCAEEREGAALLASITLHEEGVAQLNPAMRHMLGPLLPSPGHCLSSHLVQFHWLCQPCSGWEKGIVGLGTSTDLRQREKQVERPKAATTFLKSRVIPSRPLRGGIFFFGLSVVRFIFSLQTEEAVFQWKDDAGWGPRSACTLPSCWGTRWKCSSVSSGGIEGTVGFGVTHPTHRGCRSS